MLASEKQSAAAVVAKKPLKRRKLRNAEYYDMTETTDRLYAESQKGQTFGKLVELIATPENIKMAYRNIKRNKGSFTLGTDKITIEDIEKTPEDDYVQWIQKKLAWYQPKPVRRKEIPKDNGKVRPLGIPCMGDRLVQQCVLQVLEPICEAKFYKMDRNDRYRIMDIDAHNACNRDGAALRFACERLSKRDEEAKLMILISDGQPNDHGYSGSAAEADLWGVKKEYERKGITLIAAAIGADKEVIERIYENSFLNISDLQKLPVELTKLVLKNMKI